MIYLGSMSALLDGFTLWMILPYIILLAMVRLSASSASFLIATILSIICTLSLYIYFDALFIHPDPQSGLISIFLPLYQLAAIALGLVISTVAHFMQKRGQSTVVNS
jgi:hypothetical protein